MRLLKLLEPTAFTVAYAAGALAGQDLETVVVTVKRISIGIGSGPEALFRRRQKMSDDLAV